MSSIERPNVDTPTSSISNGDIVPGTLTLNSDGRGKDAYGFDQRAAYITDWRQSHNLNDGDITPGGPWTLELEPTSNCNARCYFCSYEVANAKHVAEVRRIRRQTGQRIHPSLSRDVVMQLLADLEAGRATRGLFLAGGGEPLVWPHITDTIHRASVFSDVSIQTNGIRLGKLTRDPGHLKAVRLLSVSSFAHTSTLFREIARVDKFDLVERNLRKVLDLRDKHGMNLTVNVKILVGEKNFRQLPAIVRHFRDELKVDVVALRLLQNYNYGGEGERKEPVALTPAQMTELRQMITDNHADDPLLMRFVQLLSHQLDPIEPSDHCYNAIHSHFAVIDPLGRVYLGNPEIGAALFSIGNLSTQSWKDIWGGERHTEVTRLMDEMQISGTCPMTGCRHVKANKGVESYLGGLVIPPTQEEMEKGLGSFM